MNMWLFQSCLSLKLSFFENEVTKSWESILTFLSGGGIPRMSIAQIGMFTMFLRSFDLKLLMERYRLQGS